MYIYLFIYRPVIKRNNGNPGTKWRFRAGKIIELNGVSFKQTMFDYQRVYIS